MDYQQFKPLDLWKRGILPLKGFLTSGLTYLPMDYYSGCPMGLDIASQ